ncbi:hypothetical protein M422DRAFT_783064 [Sphaerobolus stellatus SS14]|uniref:ubiquitinyl hydrolase 1 n=1 Tax=Sphaerobolus stellatus (strain SS14) TaxID=990650 RepID=A0A0C9UGI9_SPHS4|nr:hypothetical protein M422DRAFT_783064 [Sphaerobolus stellatus SS14]
MDDDKFNIAYFINHLFLPPKLPQENDTKPELQAALVRFVLKCAEDFAKNAKDTEGDEAWRETVAMLRHIYETRVHGGLYEEKLAQTMRNIGNGDVVALHIVKQNAGIIFRGRKDCIHFEYFQASPSPEAVVQTTGKLIIQFPARPRQSFPYDSECLTSLACNLAALDRIDTPDAIPDARKGGEKQTERREVADIRYISELIGGISRAVTADLDAVAATTLYIVKRIGDQVLFESAYIPWRRDPLWLVLRVALQTTLQEYGIEGALGYKSFITFVLSRVLHQARVHSFPDDLLYIMNAKIAIRMQKLDPSDLRFPFKEISFEVEECAKLLEHNWKAIQSVNTPNYDLKPPTIAEIESAKYFALPNCRGYLSEVYNRSHQLFMVSQTFNHAAHAQTLSSNILHVRHTTSPPDPIPEDISGVELWIVLLEIEKWISEGDMVSWTTITLVADIVVYLRELIYRLDGIARGAVESPESFSRIFLMILELWVQLDKTVIENIPLLLEYSPELDINSFAPLLLPSLRQMERLHTVEQYIRTRHEQVWRNNPSLFVWTNSSQSFAYRYYWHGESGSTKTLQDLHLTINAEAMKKKEAKLDELSRSVDRYHSLVRQYQAMDHNLRNYTGRWGVQCTDHVGCLRCALRKESENINIMVWEAPLPEDQVLGASVVFELAGPSPFLTWRDITFFLGRTYCPNVNYSSNVDPTPILKDYSELRKYSKVQDWQKVTIASTQKSFLKSHYHPVKIPCGSEAVIKRNALKYQFYEQECREWIQNYSFPMINIRDFCTPKLPSCAYGSLWWTVSGTSHTSNQVIARQSECPTAISYHEWGSFGELRSGHRLQCRNIMLALHVGTLTFSDSAVYLLVCQAAWQAELSLSTSLYRESHIDFLESKFGEDMLSVLKEKFDIVKENWQEGWTVGTISMLACRLHSLTPHKGLKWKVVEFLQCVRRTLRTWMTDVLGLLEQEDSNASVIINNESVLRNRVIQLATACRSTYMLGPNATRAIFKDPENVTIFVNCGVVLQNHVPWHKTQTLPAALRYSIEGDFVLSVEFSKLFQQLPLLGEGLDAAIHCSWDGFVRGQDPWAFVEGAEDRWIWCKTQTTGPSGITGYIYLNYLDGTLTVDGRSIGTLPKPMLRHGLFIKVFPDFSTQKIVPSTMRGMTYQLSRRIGEYNVNFALFEGELVIRLEHYATGEKFEFVQADMLMDDIPRSLTHQVIIIYNEELGRLEFYPTSKGWDHAKMGEPRYTMTFTNDPIQMHPEIVQVHSPQDTEYILCPSSRVVQRMSQIFNSLESSPLNLKVVWRCTKEPSYSVYGNFCLSIILSRFKLTFFVGRGGHLESREIPGMSVSVSQTVGTLFGLISKLVLDSKHGEELRQSVLVPHGEPVASMEAEQTYALVKVHQKAEFDMDVFVYDVDHIMKRLVPADTTLKSWYQLAYLHILTSSHQSDPLLDCTGLNHALHMLHSANSFAFMDLKEQDALILTSILRLCPIRTHYPRHLQCMETVSWSSDISSLNQSDLLAPLVQSILTHGQAQEIFFPHSSKGGKPAPAYLGHSILRERAAYRNARLTSVEYYELDANLINDSLYIPPRCPDAEISESQSQERTILEISTYVDKWNIRVSCLPNLWNIFMAWGSVEISDSILENLNMPEIWMKHPKSQIFFALFRKCLDITEGEKYRLMFALSILAYRKDFDLRLVYGLLAIANAPSAANYRDHISRALQHLAQVPINYLLDLSRGYSLAVTEIDKLIDEHDIGYSASKYSDLRGYYEETWDELDNRRRALYSAKLAEDKTRLTGLLQTQWINEDQPSIKKSDVELCSHDELETAARRLFKAKRANRSLLQFSNGIEDAWNAIRNSIEDEGEAIFSPLPVHHRLPHPEASRIPINLALLFRSNSLELSPMHDIGSTGSYKGRACAIPTRRSTVRKLLSIFRRSGPCGFHEIYADDLEKCIDAMEERNGCSGSHTGFCDEKADYPSQSVLHSLQPNEESVWERVMARAGLWPSSRPLALLWHLSFPARQQISDDWKRGLSIYAYSLLKQQEMRRNRLSQLNGIQIPPPVDHTPDSNWNPDMYPDWLLVQLDADITIRPVQAAIAKEMISPGKGCNTVMQLNMGEGKSSATDGTRLVRVIVPKPLSNQMFELLKQRTSGLANRRIFYLPFNRNISLDTTGLHKMLDTFRFCAAIGGILLCQPEHILSFQLMGYHMLCNSPQPLQATPWLDAQRWIQENSRDILDESDEVLNVKYQLIYTVGSPSTLATGRWCLIQDVLFLVRSEARSLLDDYRGQLEVSDASVGAFPHTRILTEACAKELVQRLAELIVMKERMPSTSFRSYSPDMRSRVLRFILSSLEDTSIAEAEYTLLKEQCEDDFEQVLLLRGLFGLGTLQLCLMEKRWRVDYGLHLVRTRLAVPYRAKDSPAPRAEFAHPDVIIVLTCLSYYYGGLSNAQLDAAFHLLMETDSPALRYDDWIKENVNNLDPNLRSLAGLNLADPHQKYQIIFPMLRYNKSVIDFYLSQGVFLKEAKEFPFKLTTNAWDLAQKKTHITTGFSGTNDNRYLLPLSVVQYDGDSQRHTNAQVLEFLLQPENGVVIETGSNTTAKQLIQLVAQQQPRVAVLLDVGAVILELTNVEVAREWLKEVINSDIEAAIYCDPESDEFFVVTRDDRIEPLASSLYRRRLDKTLVYLDEARTRGTDFKFPPRTRAVATLGPKLMKDKLVQACMRMRQLGKTHSVSFFASTEITNKIRKRTGNPEEALETKDVLLWTLHETCDQIKESGPLWASQGLNFDKRELAWDLYGRDVIELSELQARIREHEAQSLEELYGITNNHDSRHLTHTLRAQAIEGRCRQFQMGFLSRANLLEEQERELAHEKENEREVERVLDATPQPHQCNESLRHFVCSNGNLRDLMTLFECLANTTSIKLLPSLSSTFLKTTDALLATRDFAATITPCDLPTEGFMDDYLRPVQWIITSNNRSGLFVLISPYEANILLPVVRDSKHASMHLYAPRITRFGPSLEDLQFFVVSRCEATPPDPETIQILNMFAGQTFFRDRIYFRLTCQILGLHLGEIPEHLQGYVANDGFVENAEARRQLGTEGCLFQASPVKWLRSLMVWRAKGKGFILTHIGQILHGNNLREADF